MYVQFVMMVKILFCHSQYLPVNVIALLPTHVGVERRFKKLLYTTNQSGLVWKSID